ncbi:MAG: orotidine-5'-phosphate decarboxylase [Candidatus Paceibacterota bacterium]|jgi:orotidine-5'-phosphate decarboxylase
MQMPWLDPEERAELIYNLLHFGLIRSSNERDLPLKGGGKTDIYINLRDARNHPKAISSISSFYANALRRLRLHHFVEVPDSVSCFAGPISMLTGIPYLTVRESPKSGRVANATVIGSASYGNRVAILDDVVTDGASKIAPFITCVQMGLNVESLIVLVDRQQGWQEKFASLGIDLNVWPGMTLHDVRYHLIASGVMKRCETDVEERNPIIVALDGKKWEEILPIVDRLRTSGCIFKVNDLLLAEGSDWLIPNLSAYGRVMADFKGCDIPNTLTNIAYRLKRCPPWAVTVHGSGGRDMIRGVVRALHGTPTKVLVVTVLTSMRSECEEIYTRLPIEEVRTLAKIAVESGAHGIVCSSEEVAELRARYPNMEFVVPGIRSEGVDKGDQQRTDTPEAAIANGANHIVMGRQVFEANDPVAEVTRVLKDELRIF